MNTHEKMDQTKEALDELLDQLNDGDTFMLVIFSGSVEQWPKQGLVPLTKKSNSDAKARIKEMVPDGSTDINSALLSAVRSFKTVPNGYQSNLNLILFLTDGEPSRGVIDAKTIVKNVMNVQPTNVIPIYSLGFGNDNSLNYELLKNLSYRSNACPHRVMPGIKAAIQLDRLFKEINTPVLANLTIQYENLSIKKGSLTQRR